MQWPPLNRYGCLRNKRRASWLMHIELLIGYGPGKVTLKRPERNKKKQDNRKQPIQRRIEDYERMGKWEDKKEANFGKGSDTAVFMSKKGKRIVMQSKKMEISEICKLFDISHSRKVTLALLFWSQPITDLPIHTLANSSLITENKIFQFKHNGVCFFWCPSSIRSLLFPSILLWQNFLGECEWAAWEKKKGIEMCSKTATAVPSRTHWWKFLTGIRQNFRWDCIVKFHNELKCCPFPSTTQVPKMQNQWNMKPNNLSKWKNRSLKAL